MSECNSEDRTVFRASFSTFVGGRFFELDVVKATLSKQDILDMLTELPEDYPPQIKYSHLLKRQGKLPFVTVLTELRQSKVYIK